MKKFLFGCLAALSLFTSCERDIQKDPLKTVSFTFDKTLFSATGEWKNTFDPAYDNSVTASGLIFHRKASATEWGGVTYYSWKGFTPSVSTDDKNHAGEWIKYQWGAISGYPAGGNGYLIACWDTQEPLSAMPQTPSVYVSAEKGTFRPARLAITNAAYTWYVMQNGDDFCRKFGANDWLKLYIKGVKNGLETGCVTVDMTSVKDWISVDTSILGEVDFMYFQMDSSDSGQWGMNTPAYFVLGALLLQR